MSERVRLRLVGMIAVALTAVALVPSAYAEPGEVENGVLQPLADGFPSRALTLINVDDPGSRDGIYARSLQEALRGISPVDILVSDEPSPSFGTFYTLGDVAIREGGTEGYYPIIVSVPGMMSDLLTEPVTKETGLTADDPKLVIITETIPFVMIQRKDAPWGKTFAGFVEYGKANPGKVKYTSNQVGSQVDIAMEWILKQVGVEVTKIPSPDNNALAAAVGAGEADFGMTPAPVALQHYQAERVDIALVTGDSVPAPWDTDPNVTSAGGYGLPAAPFGTVQAFIVPKDTPDEHVEWLYKLIKIGAESEHHRMREKTVPGTKIKIIGPDEANATKGQLMQYLDPIVRDLGLHIDQRE